MAPVPIDPTGKHGPTRGEARGPRWRFTSRGLVVPAELADDVVEQRVLEAWSRVRSSGVVTGWAALRLHGGGFFDGLARDGQARLPVPIAANGARPRSCPGTWLVEDEIPPDEVLWVHGMRCTTPERALYDEMQRLRDVREMAVAVGSACAGRLTSVRRMRLYAATRRWYRDVRTVKEAIEMAVEDARSPQEDRFRLIWEYDARWGRPVLNRPVFDLDGELVAVPDLIDPRRGVVGEYAGADHRDIERHERDIDREARLRGVGLEYVEVVGRDLWHFDRVVTRMREAGRRALRLERRWVLGPPASPTLDELLDRRDAS